MLLFAVCNSQIWSPIFVRTDCLYFTHHLASEFDFPSRSDTCVFHHIHQMDDFVFALCLQNVFFRFGHPYLSGLTVYIPCITWHICLGWQSTFHASPGIWIRLSLPVWRLCFSSDLVLFEADHTSSLWIIISVQHYLCQVCYGGKILAKSVSSSNVQLFHQNLQFFHYYRMTWQDIRYVNFVYIIIHHY